jgi:hypothetical protein
VTDEGAAKIAGTIAVVGIYIGSTVMCSALPAGRHIGDLTAEIHALRVDLAASRECPVDPPEPAVEKP